LTDPSLIFCGRSHRGSFANDAVLSSRDTSVLLAVIMASHKNRDLQASLFASFSALSLVQDLGIADDTSSLSSSFTTLSAAAASAETFPPHDFEDGIPLHIAGWHHFADQVSQAPDGREKARSIFEFFVEAAKVSGLENTPCVTVLQEAIAACDEAPATSSGDQLSGAKKVAQKTRSSAPSYVCQLRGFTVEQIPIFNVMEAICWIYTCSVQRDEIITDRDAEYHLYQLRLIFKALKATGWFPTKVIPSTVAATWSKPWSDGASLTIAFACTCTNTNKKEKAGMAEARRVYVSGLRTLSQNCVAGSGAQDVGNTEGNCPEFVAWGAICRGDGEYRSLCLNIPRENSYKCCDHCDNLAKCAWDNKRIKIDDWFDKTSLKTGPVKDVTFGYSGCELKTVELIIQEGKRRGKVHREKRGGIGDGDFVGDDMSMEVEKWDNEVDEEMMDVDSL